MTHRGQVNKLGPGRNHIFQDGSLIERCQLHALNPYQRFICQAARHFQRCHVELRCYSQCFSHQLRHGAWWAAAEKGSNMLSSLLFLHQGVPPKDRILLTASPSLQCCTWRPTHATQRETPRLWYGSGNSPPSMEKHRVFPPALWLDR